ncbi:phage protein NinX family protein [Dickeya poaceiphila]|uniref:DUF2591 domain-containing protein n=1 Tax=Dickeya poaceiphila TaxID=568768 RepID=A0A5B8I4F9_9GAMM|nr:phage protein NinX family protein [Dickeya poaceiphila]QDX29524.1 DUF2591 domain-containing protein [Dickeya poaceiphila]
MKVKTSELSGAALDWAVATADGHEIKYDPMDFGIGANGGYWIWGDELSDPKLKIGSFDKMGYSPSTHWKECAPLIEKYGIWLSDDEDENRLTHIASIHPHVDNAIQRGETQLIAICRAVVASVLGEEVEVPQELVEVGHD